MDKQDLHQMYQMLTIIPSTLTKISLNKCKTVFHNVKQNKNYKKKTDKKREEKKTTHIKEAQKHINYMGHI